MTNMVNTVNMGHIVHMATVIIANIYIANIDIANNNMISLISFKEFLILNVK